MKSEIEDLNQIIQGMHPLIEGIRREVAKVIIGQQHMIDRMLVGLLANGHILLEGVPGLAKTAAITALAQCIHGQFQRIQFTPDLLPSDLIGNLIYVPKDGTYITKKGPIFANFVLADEINRAPAKVQSALLEAMQERQVTIGETSHPLPSPFLVMATQNPIEQEGTYALPEAQVDRFMLKVVVTYPNEEEEKKIMHLAAKTYRLPPLAPVIEPEKILEMRKLVDQIHVDDQITEYIIRLVFATRQPAKFAPPLAGKIRFGGSPRATIYLNLAARAVAFLNGRGYVTPQDVKSIAMDVLRHRVITTFEAEADEVTSEHIVQHLLDNIPVP
ncbi:AAA family ATPase [Fontisphaera persica]|jgi:MoxR-like ATPase|uniref:AAA family ATPase n=1 Tax=Fontisphaera persica TaxID=2974023 RepID=UPI003CCCD3FD